MTLTSAAIPADADTRSDFAKLSQRVAQAGLFRKFPIYYLIRASMIALLYATGLVTFWWLGESWWQIPLAVFFAVLFGQGALLAHDLAHRQVFRARRATEISGITVGNLAIGLSYGWWMNKHTRHHANPNHESRDPDVSPDILVWSDEQAQTSRGLPRFLGRWQAYLFFPLLTLEGINLHYASIKALFTQRIKRKRLESAFLFLHVAGYLTVLLFVLSPIKALVFFVVHQALWGIYMGVIFAPNHKGMPTLQEGHKLDFLRKQVLTTRNVRGNLLLDHMMGGLNYQIEHHLFPHLPMPALRRTQEIVRTYCAEIDVPYHETGLIASWGEALRHMHAVGATLRKTG